MQTLAKRLRWRTRNSEAAHVDATTAIYWAQLPAGSALVGPGLLIVGDSFQAKKELTA